MKAIVYVVLLAAATLGTPEGKRDKRGYLHGGYSSLSLDHGLDLSHSYDHDFGHDLHSIGHGHHGFGHDLHGISHGAILSAPVIHAPAAKLVSYSRVVSVPKVVEVQKIVSVPKVVSVPEVVKVSKIVEAHPHPHPHHYSHGLSSGWW